MQVGTEDLPVGALRAITAAVVQQHGRVRQRRAGRHPRVDLITTDLRVLQQQAPTHIAQLLVFLQRRTERQPAQACTGPGRPLEPERVMHLLAEHLQPAANPQHLAAVAQVPRHRRVPAIGTQVREVTAHAFRARQDNQVGGGNRLARADELQVHLRMQAQRVKVGMVADARQYRDDHLEHLGSLVDLALVDAVFGFQMQVHHVGQYADHRLAGACFQPIQPRLQQSDIAAKAVDDEALDPRLLGRRKQFEGADQMRKHAAAIDVGDQQHRAVHGFGEAHVGNVIGAQVDLRRGARAFHHHHRVGLAQARVGRQHRVHRDGFVVVIGHCVHAGHGTAMDDHLGAGVAVGLEQHWVHVGVRRQVGGLGLHRLGAADFAAFGRYRTVERHVLRFERHHRHALAHQPATQRGDQGAFAGIGRRALHHQRTHVASL